MTNDKRLRVGVVGAGFITRFQAVAMKQVRGMEFCALTQHRGTPAVAQMARDFGLGEPQVYNSVYEMARHVDCVAIFSPNHTRIPVMEEIVAAVKAGAELKGRSEEHTSELQSLRHLV